MTRRRICFIGDSITAGTGDDMSGGWPARVCAAERARGHDVTLYNLGVRADTSRGIAARWRGECEVRLAPGMNGALVFCLGVNDAAVEVGKGLRVALDESLAHMRRILSGAQGWLPTLMIGPIPTVADMQPFHSILTSYAFDNARTASYNDAFVSLAAALDIPYLDIFTPLSSNPGWEAAQRAGDGIHPGPEGYRQLAEMIAEWAPWRALWDIVPARNPGREGDILCQTSIAMGRAAAGPDDVKVS